MSILNTIGADLEQVKDMIVDYTSRDTSILSMINISKVAEASRHGYRIPFLIYRGGSYTKISLDEGTLPTGTGPLNNYMVAGYIPSAFAIKLTDEQIRLSESSEVNRYNVLSDIMANIMEEMIAHDNIHFLGNGNGWLTAVSSAKPSTTTLTFQTAGDNVGINWLRLGMAVDVWASDGTTIRIGGPYTITGLNWDSGIVTFNAAVTGLTSGDRLSVANVDEFGPSAPTTQSSTWPAFATAAGLTGDSWRHGVQYVNDADTSLYYLQKLKSAYPQLVPQKVNLDGYALSWEAIEVLKNKAIQARDDKILSGQMALMHLCQLDVLKESIVRIGRIDLNNNGGKMPDLPPQVDPMQVFNLVGMPAFASKLCDRSRVDFINPANWGRVQNGVPDYWRAPNVSGPVFMPVLGSGVYKTAWQAWVINTFDWVCHDPGASMYAYGAKVKAGYAPGSTWAP